MVQKIKTRSLFGVDKLTESVYDDIGARSMPGPDQEQEQNQLTQLGRLLTSPNQHPHHQKDRKSDCQSLHRTY
jgi:hypothetical protein